MQKIEEIWRIQDNDDKEMLDSIQWPMISSIISFQ